MKHLWSIICERSSIDYESNNLSLFNCLEQLQVTIDKSKQKDGEQLIIPLAFQLFSLWELENETMIELTIEVVDPDGSIINSLEAPFPIKGSFKRFRSRINIPGLPITISGRYLMRLKRKLQDNEFKVEAELPIEISVNFKDKIS